MTELLLIRHATNEYVDTGKLAGRLPGVHLNEYGKAQAKALGERLASAPLKAVYSSPMDRTLETAQAVVAHHPGLTVQVLEGVNELDIGVWKGEAINTLNQRKLWDLVQTFPSRVRFPGGETFRQAQLRAVDAIETVAGLHPRETVAIVSHADVIALVLAHYLGAHLDAFQRITVSTASISVIRLGHARPMIVGINDTSHCPPPPKKDESSSPTRVGNGASGRAAG